MIELCFRFLFLILNTVLPYHPASSKQTQCASYGVIRVTFPCSGHSFLFAEELIGNSSATLSETVEEVTQPGSWATSPDGTVAETSILALLLGDLC